MKPDTYTISANYWNRGSAYRWLVRKTSEPVESAKAYKSVEAEGVKFTSSNALEAGYGCRMVAVADSVTLGEPEIKEAPAVHNPSNLTQEQLGEGYRFLRPNEKQPKGYEYWQNGEWFGGENTWSTAAACNPRASVRVKIEPEAPAPEAAKVESEPEAPAAPVAETVRIAFNGSGFVKAGTREYLQRVKTLSLRDDGSMYATL